MDYWPSLLEQAKDVLKENDRGDHTVPASGLYSHQWLWDSCFVAIGQRHYDTDRAQAEIRRLLSGQWKNGMLPHMILSDKEHSWDGNLFWRSWVNPDAPDNVATSGITQPPLLAEAVYRIGQKLTKAERHRWYKSVYPALLRYHRWLRVERDPRGTGLVLQLHPWETGLDNTPPWIKEIKDHQTPVWIRALAKLHLAPLLNVVRRDTKFAPVNERADVVESLTLFTINCRLHRKNYDIRRVLTRDALAIEDLTFNCILIRAGKLLRGIAKTIGETIPDDVQSMTLQAESALEQLWDPHSEQYYSRNFTTRQLIKEPSIAALMPLYAGALNKERAGLLVKQLEDEQQFGSVYPVPSVPVNSPWFSPRAYWQGPTWINTNWLIIDGLKRNGFAEHAAALRESTLEMVAGAGFYEYFSPLDGKPAGVKNLSWTAALIIDLLYSKS